MEIGKNLRRLRSRAGLTQQEIADKLDVSRVAIGGWNIPVAITVEAEPAEARDFSDFEL